MIDLSSFTRKNLSLAIVWPIALDGRLEACARGHEGGEGKAAWPHRVSLQQKPFARGPAGKLARKGKKNLIAMADKACCKAPPVPAEYKAEGGFQTLRSKVSQKEVLAVCSLLDTRVTKPLSIARGIPGVRGWKRHASKGERNNTHVRYFRLESRSAHFSLSAFPLVPFFWRCRDCQNSSHTDQLVPSYLLSTHALMQ
jgi:hypothetical protein